MTGVYQPILGDFIGEKFVDKIIKKRLQRPSLKFNPEVPSAPSGGQGVTISICPFSSSLSRESHTAGAYK